MFSFKLIIKMQNYVLFIFYSLLVCAIKVRLSCIRKQANSSLACPSPMALKGAALGVCLSLAIPSLLVHQRTRWRYSPPHLGYWLNDPSNGQPMVEPLSCVVNLSVIHVVSKATEISSKMALRSSWISTVRDLACH